MFFLGSWGIKGEGMKKAGGGREEYEWFLAVLLNSSAVSQWYLEMGR